MVSTTRAAAICRLTANALGVLACGWAPYRVTRWHTLRVDHHEMLLYNCGLYSHRIIWFFRASLTASVLIELRCLVSAVRSQPWPWPL